VSTEAAAAEAAPKPSRSEWWRPRLRERFEKIAGEHATPARIGVAVGVGVLIGCSPFIGFQVLICAVLAIALRLNKLAVFLGLQISAPPATPFVMLAGVELGELVLHGRFLPLDPDVFRAMPGVEIARLFFVDLAVGGTLMGLVLGAGLGLLAARWVERRRAKAA